MKPRRILHQKFEPWMIEKLNAHIASGWSLACFPGHFNISDKAWRYMLKTVPELKQMREEYMAKIRHGKRSGPYMNGLN